MVGLALKITCSASGDSRMYYLGTTEKKFQPNEIELAVGPLFPAGINKADEDFSCYSRCIYYMFSLSSGTLHYVPPFVQNFGSC